MNENKIEVKEEKKGQAMTNMECKKLYTPRHLSIYTTYKENQFGLFNNHTTPSFS